MRDSVIKAFPAFTQRFEGCLRYMYLDVLGLVTTGRGNLIDPLPMALPLPWKHGDGTPANQEEITEEWQQIKARSSLDKAGGGAYFHLATLLLDQVDVDKLTVKKAMQMDSVLKGRFPEWDIWPASAQLGALSLAWACGPRFHYPRFEAAAHNQDWVICAEECTINSTNNPGVMPRNAANKRLFRAAVLTPTDQLPDGIC